MFPQKCFLRLVARFQNTKMRRLASNYFLSLLHTSDVSTSAIASARTFTLEHKRRKQGGLYLALTIALTFCRFTLEDFWHKRNRKHKTSTRKTIFLFLALVLAIMFFSLHTRFFCVAIAIALALTSLVWSRLYYAATVVLIGIPINRVWGAVVCERVNYIFKSDLRCGEYGLRQHTIFSIFFVSSWRCPNLVGNCYHIDTWIKLLNNFIQVSICLQLPTKYGNHFIQVSIW